MADRYHKWYGNLETGRSLGQYISSNGSLEGNTYALTVISKRATPLVSDPLKPPLNALSMNGDAQASISFGGSKHLASTPTMTWTRGPVINKWDGIVGMQANLESSLSLTLRTAQDSSLEEHTVLDVSPLKTSCFPVGR